MPKEIKQKRGKQVAAAPYDKKTATKAPVKGGKKGVPAQPAKKASKGPSATLFEKRPKNFGIGQDVQPKRDVTRFVRWPKYIRMQRQKRVLLHRLKVPPTINQFTRTLDKNLGRFNFYNSTPHLRFAQLIAIFFLQPRICSPSWISISLRLRPRRPTA
jgi:hypothetical protein